MAVIDWFKHRFTKSRYASDKSVDDLARVAKERGVALDYDRDERLADLLVKDDPENLEEIAKLLGQSNH